MAELTKEMTGPVIRFLRQTLPMDREIGTGRDGWNDMALTAYEIGCMALVALGEAQATAWGAARVAEPRLPEVLPLWEDIAVAVLWLAQQQNMLTYRQMDGSPQPPRRPRAGGFTVTLIGESPPAPPNILAGPGSGPAMAASAVVPALEALGLVAGGRWTVAAEVVLWRGSGGAWGLSFEEDARFLAAVESAVRTMPDAFRMEIDGLMRVRVEELATPPAQYDAPPPPSGKDQFVAAPPTLAQKQRLVAMRRERDLDWIFFRHWRLGRGWLDEASAGRALEIFHDRLAIAMRKAVIGRLYPGGFVWE